MPEDVDLRPLLGPEVLDQGCRPTCLAFAVSAAHEAMRGVDGAPGVHLAPEALWWHSTRLDLTSADGMALHDIRPALRDCGQPELDLWPYDPTLGASGEAPPPTVPRPPWHRADLSILTLHRDGIEAPLEGALRDGRPVVLTVAVTDDFYRPDGHGVVAVADPGRAVIGYHAVVCVGAFTHPTHGRLLLVKNSWGVEWGRGGYGWLPISFLVHFAAAAAVIVKAGGQP